MLENVTKKWQTKSDHLPVSAKDMKSDRVKAMNLSRALQRLCGVEGGLLTDWLSSYELGASQRHYSLTGGGRKHHTADSLMCLAALWGGRLLAKDTQCESTSQIRWRLKCCKWIFEISSTDPGCRPSKRPESRKNSITKQHLTWPSPGWSLFNQLVTPINRDCSQLSRRAILPGPLLSKRWRRLRGFGNLIRE